MTLHPKERRGHTRRDLLARAGGAALGLSSAGSLLAACSNSTTPGGGTSVAGQAPTGPGGLPLARPDKRVTLPRWEDPIASGLQPETGGTFTIFNYPDYMYTEAVQGVLHEVQRDPAVHAVRQHRLGDPAARVRVGDGRRDGDDAGQPRPGRRRQADQADQPRLHPQPGRTSGRSCRARSTTRSRYTVPYTSYKTGIAWRTDKVKEDIASMQTLVDLLELADLYRLCRRARTTRETIAMALLGARSPTSTPRIPAGQQAPGRPEGALQICNLKINITEYQTLPEGRPGCTSPGRAISSALRQLPAQGRRRQLLQLLAAPKGKGPIQNDCWAISATTKSRCWPICS